MTAAGRVRVSRKPFANGSAARVFEIRAPSLDPVRLSAPSAVRAREVADIFAAKIDGPVAAVALPPRTLGAGLAPERLRRFENETYLTLRAVLGRMFVQGRLPTDDGRMASGASPWLRTLEAQGLIAIAGAPGREGALPLRLPVGSLGHLRAAGRSLRDRVLVNTHYFLLSAVELDSPFAAIGDALGLDASRGSVRNPPTVRRAALVRTDAGWSVRQVGAEDVEIAFSDGTVVRGGDAGGGGGGDAGGGPDVPRFGYRGHPDGDEQTPVRDGGLDVCIQGDRASVARAGGGLAVPHGALVVSFPEPPSDAFLAALRVDPRVRISFPATPDLVCALQAGPQLVREGDVVVDASSFEAESFRTLGMPNAVAPVVFPADHDRTSAARAGVGVCADGTLVLVVVEGASSLTGPVGEEPAGCTLGELAVLLRDAGAVDALNLDGGGSTQVFHGAGALLASADARGVPGASFDRPVPLAACAGPLV